MGDKWFLTIMASAKNMAARSSNLLLESVTCVRVVVVCMISESNSALADPKLFSERFYKNKLCASLTVWSVWVTSKYDAMGVYELANRALNNSIWLPTAMLEGQVSWPVSLWRYAISYYSHLGNSVNIFMRSLISCVFSNIVSSLLCETGWMHVCHQLQRNMEHHERVGINPRPHREAISHMAKLPD